MMLAMIYPDPAKGGRGKTLKFLEGFENKASAQTMLGQARQILRHSVELAQDVLHRGTHFDLALKQVRGSEDPLPARCHGAVTAAVEAPQQVTTS